MKNNYLKFLFLFASIPFLNLQLNAQCPVSFSTTNNGSGSFTFTAQNSNPSGWVAVYSWSFGDGSSGSGSPANHQYNSPGVFIVSVSMFAFDPSDSTQNCSAIAYDSLYYSGSGGTGNCNLTITNTNNGSGNFTFTAQNSIPSGWIAFYGWNFGDGTSGSGSTTSHQYNAGGVYVVSASMFAFDPSDSTQNCSVVAYDSLFYSGSGGTGSCNLLANVGYLNTSGNSYNIYGTSSGGNVTYSYLSINSNSFTLYPNTNFVSINVPTLGTTQVCYYVEDSSATGFCYDSSCVIISPSNPSNACAANILLWQDSVNTMTWYGYNLATGAQPLTYFWSFGDGTSSNQAFPSHTYAVPGTYVICLTITDNNGCTSTSCDSSMAFRLNNSNSQNSVSQISILNPLGLSEISPIKNASVFPNPIIDQANLSFTCENSSNASIQVRNVFGSLLSETNLITKQGNNNSELNLSGIPNGVYFVDIRIEGKLKQTLKVIK